MKSGRFIGVMSGTSLDGVDVVLAAINEDLVAQQASLTRLNQPLYPWPLALALLGSVLLCLPQLSMRWPHGRRSA